MSALQLDLLDLLAIEEKPARGMLDSYPDVVKNFSTCTCGHSLLHHAHRGPVSAPMAECDRCSCPGGTAAALLTIGGEA